MHITAAKKCLSGKGTVGILLELGKSLKQDVIGNGMCAILRICELNDNIVWWR